MIAPPPRSAMPIYLSVALVAASALQLEILVSRFFSVLFFYHFSFFAVGIVMTGITLGGLLSARLLRADSPAERHLVRSAVATAWGTVLATLFLAFFSRSVDMLEPAWYEIALLALAYLPALTASGYFLATAFARNRERIGRLYAVDLLAAAVAVAAVVLVMRIWQGVASAFVPALLAALGGFAIAERRRLAVALGTALPLGAAVLWSGLSERPLIPLPEAYNRTEQLLGPVIAERWNEHSRVIAVQPPEVPGQLRENWLFIDKEAATKMYAVPRREPGAPPPIPAEMRSFNNSVMYRVPRPLDRVAVIGIGGGQDLLVALGQGAKRVEGYELNAIFRDWLRGEFFEFSGGMANWPEIEIVHDEGRVGIASSGRKYDLIVASMIDTWAATANGGLVLSENSLYTVEGWQELLECTTPRGSLAMTRWYLPAEPVELQRLIVVASEALERVGVSDPTNHVLLIVNGTEDFTKTLTAEQLENLHLMGTLIASREAFTASEVAAIASSMERDNVQSRMLYPAPDAPAWVGALLDPARRAGTIAASEFDITATTDDRPYFFLQLGLADLARLFGTDPVGMRKVTYNGVRVLLAMTTLSALFAAAVLLLAPGRGGSGRSPAWRPLSLYFAGVGVGFVLVQIGLLGRLIIPLGHPTYAFTTILFSMLLSTGVGSWLSGRLTPARFPAIWCAIPLGMLAIAASFSLFGEIGKVDSWPLRVGLAALAPSAAGLLLGFCFPLGVRVAESLGEGAVQRLWAINGASGILGSAVAGLIGVIAGGRATVIAGALCYAVVAAAGIATLKRSESSARTIRDA